MAKAPRQPIDYADMARKMMSALGMQPRPIVQPPLGGTYQPEQMRGVQRKARSRKK